MQCCRKDGTLFWLGLHVMPVHDANPPCSIVLGRDITEALQTRQQQAAIQGLLAKVFQCVKAPVAIVTDNGIMQMSNPALDDLLGYPPGGLVGKRAIDLNAPRDRPAATAIRQRQVTDGKDYTTATNLLRADGSEIAVEITSTTVQRDDLRHFRIITVFRRPDGAPRATIHVAGKIRLVGLDEVKVALGSRWAAVAAKALVSAEHVVRRHCGPRDTWSRTSDGGFLICYADASEDEGAFRAAALARDIRNKLIGEGETGATATVSAHTAAVDVPDVPGGRSADMLASIIDQRLNSRLAAIETQARETLRQAAYTTTSRLEPVRSRRTREIFAQFAKLPPAMEQHILAAYSALPMNERKGFDFDRLVLGLAAEQAITEIAAGGSSLVLVNVDFEVFLDRHRTERYVAACRTLDNRLRERLVLVLSGMPKGFPKSRVLECVMLLRPFCHGVGFQLDSIDAPLIDSSLLGAAIVVLPVERKDLQTGKDLAKLAKVLETLHAYQAQVLIRHVPSWEDAKNLARVGVDLLSMVDDERDASPATAGH